MPRHLACILFTLAILGCGRHKTGDASSASETRGYADPGSCDGCHSDIAASYRTVAMSRSFRRADPADVIEDYTRKNRLTHEPSGFTYEMLERDGRFFQRRFERHVLLARSRSTSFREVRASIVNPARLPPERRMDVCMQCHLETTSGGNWSGVIAFGRGVFSFRPGDELAAYVRHFDHPPGTGHEDKFEIAHQAYRLRQSACFKASAGRMTCTTCHDPHRRPADPAAHYTAR